MATTAPGVRPPATAPTPTTASGGDDEYRTYTHRQILAIMSGLVLGMLLAALDQTIVATALTRISQDFHRPDLYSWVVTSYLLTSTATTPLYGKISDLFGRKRIFQFAIVVFLIGSALSGLSGSMYQLIAFRAVQGLGAGGLMSLALSIVGDVIPPRDRGRYQGYFGGVFGAASVLGPLIGGFLVDQVSWRWVFYVNIPLGVIALVVINRVLQLDHQRSRAKIDVPGAVLLVGGVSMILIAVQNIGSQARIDTASWGFAIVGVAFIVAFVLWERVASEPILPLSLFRNPIFRVTASLSLITGAVMFGAIIFLPQYMQLVRGVSPTLSGLRLLPLLAGLLFTSIGSGQLISRGSGYKKFVVVGTAVLTAGTVLLTQIHFATSFWWVSLFMFVVGFGLGLFMQTTVLATQNSVARTQMGVATSAVTFSRTLGGAIGASVLGAVLIEHERTTAAANIERYGPALGPLHAFVGAMDRAYVWAIPVAALAFVLSFALKEVRLRTGAANPGTAAAEGGAPPEAPQHDTAVERAAIEAEPMPEQHGSVSGPSVSGASVSGTVRGLEGSPLPDVAVTLTDLAGRQVARTVTEAAGSYELFPPAHRSYLLIFASQTSAPSTDVVAVDGEPVRRDVSLARTATVTGRLCLAETTAPVPGGSVVLTDRDGVVVASRVVDESGAFTLSVPAGEYTFTATGPTCQPQTRAIRASAGASLHVETALAPAGGAVGGVVLAATDSRPLPDATVDVRAADGTVVGHSSTDSEGRYTLEGLPPGHYTVTARGFSPVTRALHVSDGDSRLDLELGAVGE
jgi:EmrB/QacA subfamily drug resistance transporter